MQFIVLSSSKGTVFQSVLDRMEEGTLSSECLGLIADREDRGCVLKARAAGLPVMIVAKAKDEDREAYDRRVADAIGRLGGSDETLIACIGWLWILSPWFVSAFRNRILNVHPALLPKHPGAHAHALVLAAKDSESGMSIHLIDEGMDTGKILLQKNCPVLPDDTEDSLKKRVQELEGEWYPKVLQMIEEGEIRLTI